MSQAASKGRAHQWRGGPTRTKPPLGLRRGLLLLLFLLNLLTHTVFGFLSPAPTPGREVSRPRISTTQLQPSSRHPRFLLQAVAGPPRVTPTPDKRKSLSPHEDDEDEKVANIVLVAGFEAFNLALYKSAASKVREVCPRIRVSVFTDRDITEQPEVVSSALAKAQVFFGSLIFDYDQVSWLKDRINAIPTRFVFESALELMSSTSVGSFSMANSNSGQASGPPPAVKALLSKFSSNREEDRLKGYLNFLKIGPSLLKLVPGKKAGDLRTWLEVYSYWNQGGLQNVVSMFLLLAKRLSLVEASLVAEPMKVVETPGQGLIHPLTPEIFQSPRKYLRWYMEKSQDARHAAAMAPPGAPRVAILLYRKHVITKQLYITQMLRIFEQQGILPVPIFINGVEAHTIVRDLLTSRYEQEQRGKGITVVSSLSPEAIEVDAVVNTIGFPLVGGPAGSMEAGRRVDVATQLLAAKNIPYFVSAPLLIQDLKSWRENGVQGLQSVVLYSLPELDGAVDTVVLGGLVGDKIALVPERVRKLARRIKAWVNLRSTAPSQRKVAVLLYGFPPNVGAIGTAALLNVPKSLESLLKKLQAAGYDTGIDAEKIDGESVVAVLTAISQDAVVAGGSMKMKGMVSADTFGPAVPNVCVTAEGVTAMALREAVGDLTAARIEKQWGDLSSYVGLCTSQDGELMVGGVQLGNVWIGVQPLLGIEGDPMRLMFERDLTPHPQYVAYYDWMRKQFGAQAVVHFGMHGTMEWLPGSPLGNTAETWPDILMGDIPNIYLYACNNPSESILAKRRGYGTLVSHNVPPYSRAGLYKELTQLKELVYEYREQPEANHALRPVIAGVLERTGLYEDCPYKGRSGSNGRLSQEQAQGVDAAEFEEYVVELTTYLSVLEQRLFSEGLHVLGQKPTPGQVAQYLDAYFSGSVPAVAIEAISQVDTGEGVDSSVLMSRLREQLRSIEGGEGIQDIIKAINTPEVSSSRPLTVEERYSDSLLGWDYIRFFLLQVRRSLGDARAASEIQSEVSLALGVEPDDGMSTSPTSTGGMSQEEQQGLRARLVEGLEIKRLLGENEEEVHSVVRALNGEYVLPGVGGDLLRDGTGVLPTGRNIHALDPYRLPSPAAWARGREAAEKIIEQHVASEGTYPETVAVMLWGLDAIKTRGESVAILLALVGARPVKEGTGRIVKYELMPLEELGRPRVDVLASLSGIFRDSFANVVDLLDDLFERAAMADEPPEMNFIRKHALKLEAQGVDRPSARLFSNPAGDFGSLVNERVGNGDWENEEELGTTWESRNAFSFGRGKEKGVKRDVVLKELLQSTERIVQEIDSVEYGLSDIQEYYANTGALKKAAENNQVVKSGSGKKKSKVKVSIVEAFSKQVEPKELEATLRLEYRSKLLNPKWAKAMSAQGSGGAYEISQRMTALVGWSGTAEFKEQWVYDGAADTYAFDPEMAELLAKNNPEAFRNIVKRMLEANGRGYWKASDEKLDRLRELYSEVEDEIEWSGGKGVRTSVVRLEGGTATPVSSPPPRPLQPKPSSSPSPSPSSRPVTTEARKAPSSGRAKATVGREGGRR